MYTVHCTLYGTVLDWTSESNKLPCGILKLPKCPRFIQILNINIKY